MKIFEDPVPWQDIATSSAVLGAYAVAFVVTAWVIFKRKDILT
jgi:ABC-type transport system involved in multi-copper enzyme maturation permease subunit